MLKKSLVSLLVGISIVGLVGCGEAKVSKEKYDKIKNELLVQKTENAQNKNKIKGLNKENDKLREKIESAKNYLDLDENEKEIIDTKIDEVNKATEDQLAQEKQEQEEAKRVQEEKANSHIGETIKFTQSGCINPGDFNLTIDNVYLTDERNMFADQVKYVVVIEYTVESVNINDLDFFLDNNANFYDSNGYKCKTYPNVSNKSTYDIDKGMKAKGQFSIGITESDTPYLEMKYGGIEYKWNL